MSKLNIFEKKLLIGSNLYLSARKKQKKTKQKKTALKLKEKCVNEPYKVTFVHMIVTDVHGTLYSKCRYESREREVKE